MKFIINVVLWQNDETFIKLYILLFYIIDKILLL